MKEYKLIKEIPSHKVGDVHSHINWVNYFCMSVDPSEFSEFFEEVKEPEFKKEFFRSGYETDGMNMLTETFETEQQREAEKALREHIYKFDEPEEDAHYYRIEQNLDNWKLLKVSLCPVRYYNKSINHEYRTGITMNINTTKEDRTERIRLIEQTNK